jgi:hypothetical protein
MADFYTQFCFGFPVHGDQGEYLRSLLGKYEVQHDVDTVTPLDDEIDLTFEREGNETIAIFSPKDGGLNILHDSIQALAVVLQAFLQFTRRHDEAIYFTWAETCSRVRVDQFDGGACVVTKDEIRWFRSREWINQQAVNFANVGW